MKTQNESVATSPVQPIAESVAPVTSGFSLAQLMAMIAAQAVVEGKTAKEVFSSAEKAAKDAAQAVNLAAQKAEIARIDAILAPLAVQFPAEAPEEGVSHPGLLASISLIRKFANTGSCAGAIKESGKSTGQDSGPRGLGEYQSEEAQNSPRARINFSVEGKGLAHCELPLLLAEGAKLKDLERDLKAALKFTPKKGDSPAACQPASVAHKEHLALASERVFTRYRAILLGEKAHVGGSKEKREFNWSTQFPAKVAPAETATA